MKYYRQLLTMQHPNNISTEKHIYCVYETNTEKKGFVLPAQSIKQPICLSTDFLLFKSKIKLAVRSYEDKYLSSHFKSNG